MPLRVDEGLTLRTTALRDADLIVSVFTREHGRVRGVARGARKLKNRFGAALEPMSRARFIWFEREGSDLVTLDEADLLSCPRGSGGSLEAAWTLQYLAEVVDQVAVEGDAQPKLYRLLVAVTDALAAGTDPAVAARYFELWLLKLQGVMPGLSRCALCGRALESGRAVLGEERLACASCAAREGDRTGSLSVAALAFLRDAERLHVQELRARTPDRAAVREAGDALRRLMTAYLGREPRALAFLEKLEVLP